jgi:hypothetical protein
LFISTSQILVAEVALDTAVNFKAPDRHFFVNILGCAGQKHFFKVFMTLQFLDELLDALVSCPPVFGSSAPSSLHE